MGLLGRRWCSRRSTTAALVVLPLSPSTPEPGAWGGLEVRDAADQFGSSTRGGRIELKHARVSFAGVGVATAYNCGGNCNVPPAQLSSVLLDHVSVSRSQRGVSLGGVGRSSIGSVQVNDSSFDHNKGATLLEGESVSVVRSSFTSTDAQGEGALRVRSEGSPRVQDNVFTDTGSSDASSPCAHSFCDPTVAVASPKLDLGLLTGISGSGNVAASFGLGGTLVASGSLASLPSGWTPIIERAYGSLKVPSGVTLTVPAGTVVKSGGWPDFEAAVSVEGGSLVADGTVGAPVVFTSIYDGSVGGATSESFDPQPGAWGGIKLDTPEAALNGSFIKIRFATSAINVENGTSRVSGLALSNNSQGLVVKQGNVALRGHVDVPREGVHACNWGYDCFVDASSVDWPTGAGPFPPTGDLVCGSASVSPWTSDSAPFRVANCDGSPTRTWSCPTR